jgi:signal transduction histidine kinase
MGPPRTDAGEDSGHGLTGMRERVAVYGGELSAGPQRGGGFAVRAHLPLDAGSPQDDGSIPRDRDTRAAATFEREGN